MKYLISSIDWIFVTFRFCLTFSLIWEIVSWDVNIFRRIVNVRNCLSGFQWICCRVQLIKTLNNVIGRVTFCVIAVDDKAIILYYSVVGSIIKLTLAQKFNVGNIMCEIIPWHWMTWPIWPYVSCELFTPITILTFIALYRWARSDIVRCKVVTGANRYYNVNLATHLGMWSRSVNCQRSLFVWWLNSDPSASQSDTAELILSICLSTYISTDQH